MDANFSFCVSGVTVEHYMHMLYVLCTVFIILKLYFHKQTIHEGEGGISVVRHLPLVLEVPGSIPARSTENFGVQHAFPSIICRDDTR